MIYIEKRKVTRCIFFRGLGISPRHSKARFCALKSFYEPEKFGLQFRILPTIVTSRKVLRYLFPVESGSE